MHRSNHDTSQVHERDQSPSGGQPVIGRRGLTIPWGWLASMVPTSALGGAILHGSLFGAPPEFSKRLDEHQRSIVELHEDAALTKQQMRQIADDVKFIRDHLPR